MVDSLIIAPPIEENRKEAQRRKPLRELTGVAIETRSKCHSERHPERHEDDRPCPIDFPNRLPFILGVHRKYRYGQRKPSCEKRIVFEPVHLVFRGSM